MTPSESSLSGRQPKAVQSAFRVLEQVAQRGAGVSAKEIAHATGLPPATTYRLLNLLVAEGYLVRMPDLHGFALGQKLGALVGTTPGPQVCHAARVVLADLRGSIRFGVHLVRYGQTSIRIADPDPDHPFVAGQLLTRYLHATSVGRVYLAEQHAWREVWPEARLRQATPLTTTSPRALDGLLADVRALGFARQSGELRPEAACLAVPVRSVTGKLVAAIAVSAPVDRAAALDPLVEPLQLSAADLAPLLA